MTHPPSVPTRPENPYAECLAPLSIWLSICLIALAISVLRVPLSANYPRPAESLALPVLLITQLVFSGLLCPFLLRTWRTMFVVIVASWPFIFLAGYLSFTPTLRELLCALYLSIWLTSLGVLRSVLS